MASPRARRTVSLPVASPLQQAYAALTGRRGPAALAAAALLGAVGQLAHAPFHLWPFFVLSFAGLLWLLDGAINDTPRPKLAAFWRAYAFGFGYFLAGTFWIGNAFAVFSAETAWLSPIAIMLMPIVLGVFFGLAGLLASFAWTRDARRAPVLAVALTVAEYARGHLFGGFPWDLPGTIWPAGGAISQLASMVGIYGLSALTLMLAASFGTIIDARGEMGKRVMWPLTCAVALGIAFGWGSQRPPAAEAQPPITSVRVVNSGFSQSEKWDEARNHQMFATFIAETGEDLVNSPRLIVWPESALPFPLLETPEAMDTLGRVLGERALIAGTFRIERGDKTKFYNSLAVIAAPKGVSRVISIYDKHKLVPFGEYVPPVIGDMLRLIGAGTLSRFADVSFTPGGRPGVYFAPGAPAFSALICYESIFPRLAARGSERPNWLVNVSVDGWYSATGPFQHFNQARYRAIEEGLSLVRSASGGTSAVIDPYGRLASKTLNGRGFIDANVPAPLQPTLFSRFGDYLLLLVLALLILLRTTISSAEPT